MTLGDAELLGKDWVWVPHADGMLHDVRLAQVVLVVGEHVMVEKDEVLVCFLKRGREMRGLFRNCLH